MSATLIVAVIALVLSVGSLTWQIAQFLLAGSRVSAELQIGAHSGSAVALRPADRRPDWDRLAAEGFTEAVLGVTARNKGRIGVTVMSWKVVFDNGLSFSLADYRPNNDKPMPYRLEPGDEVTWLCPAAAVMAAGRSWREAIGDHPGRIRARVTLGTGKEITGETAIALV